MSDAVDLIAALGDGEVVTYIPHNGTAKQFTALIPRDRPDPAVGSSGGVSYGVTKFEVWIPMDAANGVLVVQERKDKIRFKKQQLDAEDTEFLVTKILTHDSGMVASAGGMFRIEVQA